MLSTLKGGYCTVNQRGNIVKPGCSTVNRQVSTREFSASRREFLTRVPGAAAATLASTAIPFGSAEGSKRQGNGSDGTDRVRDSYEIQKETAQSETEIPVPRQISNGDEPNSKLKFIGNYSKRLPHNAIGEVDPTA